ncbi:MAG: hypothetical protein KBS36_05285 [Bacteroidales bacterium]|nr:hypothetical protein [Candidatus Cryptobacteroides fimicaballi]
MKKNYRKNIISLILSTQRIHTQEELLSALKEKGINVTQATLSRDMKDLGAYKFTEAGGEIYYKTAGNSNHEKRQGMVKTIDVSGQMCVIHCKPGFAPAVASLIDESYISGIMGSIAGDDTVLVILREDADRDKIISSIKDILLYNE